MSKYIIDFKKGFPVAVIKEKGKKPQLIKIKEVKEEEIKKKSLHKKLIKNQCATCEENGCTECDEICGGCCDDCENIEC